MGFGQVVGLKVTTTDDNGNDSTVTIGDKNPQLDKTASYECPKIDLQGTEVTEVVLWEQSGRADCNHLGDKCVSAYSIRTKSAGQPEQTYQCCVHREFPLAPYNNIWQETIWSCRGCTFATIREMCYAATDIGYHIPVRNGKLTGVYGFEGYSLDALGFLFD